MNGHALAVAGVAVVLGLAGTALGIVALATGGGFEEKTLELRESKGSEERIDFQTGTAHPSHQFDGWTIVRQVSGDSTGEHTVTCLGIVRDNIECNGAFQLEDGDLEVEGTSEAKRTGQATNAIVGGTGAYEGATGEVEIDYVADTFKLHLLIPE